MSECRYNGRTEPRTLPDRHRDDCYDETCPGCAPCPRAHCRVCGIAHDAGTCPECMAETREALREIGRMCDALPEEVEHRGVEGEAMMLLGPATDPERRGHLEASVLAGRIPWEAIESSHVKGCDDPRCTGCAGELHPNYVLGGWDAVWREALDHDEPEGRFRMAETIDYLDRTMGYMGSWPHVPFEEFAKDLRRSCAHLEAVLHDGEQIDRGVACLNCGTELRRVWKGDLLPWSDLYPQKAPYDGWACTRCRRTSTEAQYDLAVKADYIAKADWLPAEDMAVRTGVKASTIRSWASDKRDRPALVRKTLRAERVVYSVEDVEREKARVAA